MCTERPGMVTLLGGLRCSIDRGLGAFDNADTVIVPTWPRRTKPSPAVIAVLQRAHHRGARMVSFCSGAFALAAAGLLDGRPATTRWNAADELHRRHASIHLDPGVLYVDDGEVLTSVGSAAGIDLAIHLIGRDYGSRIANLVAREMVVAPHRQGGQAQVRGIAGNGVRRRSRIERNTGLDRLTSRSGSVAVRHGLAFEHEHPPLQPSLR